MKLRSGSVFDNDCGKIGTCTNCVMCKKGSVDTSLEYYNKITNEKFMVKDRFDCNSQGIIYLISCKDPDCNVQYIGRTISTI